tara:strand:+ start:1069 stop:2859 length:1791 start_codon:yes stop_codon:yes gene_type:complete
MATLDRAKEALKNQRETVKEKQIEAQLSAIEISANSAISNSLVDPAMMVQTMRNVRYSSEANAAGDIMDNAVEAGARNVHVAFRLNKKNQISEIAFIDDGSGMIKEFLTYATKFGGSSNQKGSRNTFGRFGFGLPSASINQGTAYTVISRTDEQKDFWSVTVDLDTLFGENNNVILPTSEQSDLPDWIVDYIQGPKSRKDPVFPGGVEAVRTIVIWKNLDKAMKTVGPSSKRYKEYIGITYASWMQIATFVVNGDKVEPIDPLFTTPGHLHYEVDGQRVAQAQDSITFPVKDEYGTPHDVVVRFSYFPMKIWNTKTPNTKGTVFPIRKNHNGIFVTRNGRFIELVKWREISWRNNSRNVGVALDFPPALDEKFGVTPDKQSISFSESISDLMKTAGVVRAVNSLISQRNVEADKIKSNKVLVPNQNGDLVRPSELTIEKAMKELLQTGQKTSAEKSKEADENLQKEIDAALASTPGLSEEQVQEAIEKVAISRPYKVVTFDGTSDDPFYRPRMIGVQAVLELNTGHPFYTDLYGQLAAEQSQVRSALELFLWILSLEEIDATGDSRVFYRQERAKWSSKLANALMLHERVFEDFKV